MPVRKAILRSEILEFGGAPMRSFTAVIYYTDGTIDTFDGKTWKINTTLAN